MPLRLTDFASEGVEPGTINTAAALPAFPDELRHCLLVGPEHRSERS